MNIQDVVVRHGFKHSFLVADEERVIRLINRLYNKYLNFDAFFTWEVKKWKQNIERN